jgi:hypothetical protein
MSLLTKEKTNCKANRILSYDVCCVSDAVDLNELRTNNLARHQNIN